MKNIIYEGDLFDTLETFSQLNNVFEVTFTKIINPTFADLRYEQQVWVRRIEKNGKVSWVNRFPSCDISSSDKGE